MEKSEKTDPPNEVLNTKRDVNTLMVYSFAILILF